MIKLATEPQFNIVEIFQSLQGEGYNTGMDAIFIRFGKCNLACPWCDTDYLSYSTLSLSEILKQVEALSATNIIITGGEPSVVPEIDLLLKQLKQRGYFLTIETNGLQPVPSEIDFISASPKALYAKKYHSQMLTQADEVRIVVDGDVFDFCQFIEQHLPAKHYYLSPCEQITVSSSKTSSPSFTLLETLQLLGRLNQRGQGKPHWQLSLQTHKLLGIR